MLYEKISLADEQYKERELLLRYDNLVDCVK